MAGHSKWANIKHRKAQADAKKGKVFTRLIRELTVASRAGGADPSMNPRLRLAMEKAAEANMSKDTVQRAVQRGAGLLDGADYQELRYEGYGISGIAVVVDCLTDNKTRTAADVRHAFSKHGGNLGTTGSVAFQFDFCGQMMLSQVEAEEAILEVAVAAGAQDVIVHEDAVEIITVPADFEAVQTALQEAEFKIDWSELGMRPQTTVSLSPEDEEKLQRLLDALEALEDVNKVYTNAA